VPGQIRLCDVTGVEVADRRGYLTLEVEAGREGVLQLRRAEGLQEWAAALEAAWRACSRRRMASTEQFWRRPGPQAGGLDLRLLRRPAGGVEAKEPRAAGVPRPKAEPGLQSRSTPALAKPALPPAPAPASAAQQPVGQVVMRRPAALQGGEGRARGKRRARSECRAPLPLTSILPPSLPPSRLSSLPSLPPFP
jgi:hypothetical protein